MCKVQNNVSVNLHNTLNSIEQSLISVLFQKTFDATRDEQRSKQFAGVCFHLISSDLNSFIGIEDVSLSKQRDRTLSNQYGQHARCLESELGFWNHFDVLGRSLQMFVGQIQ